MAASTRIQYGSSSIGGIHQANAVRYTILAQQEQLRAKAWMDSITANGVTPANLDSNADFGTTGANGAVLYSAAVTLNTALQALNSALLSNLDPG